MRWSSFHSSMPVSNPRQHAIEPEEHQHTYLGVDSAHIVEGVVDWQELEDDSQWHGQQSWSKKITALLVTPYLPFFHFQNMLIDWLFYLTVLNSRCCTYKKIHCHLLTMKLLFLKIKISNPKYIYTLFTSFQVRMENPVCIYVCTYDNRA